MRLFSASLQDLYVMITQDTYSTISSVVDNLGWNILEQHRHLQKFCKAMYGTAGIKFSPEVQPLSQQTRLPNPHPYLQLQCTAVSFKFHFIQGLFLYGITSTFCRSDKFKSCICDGHYHIILLICIFSFELLYKFVYINI